MLGFFRFMPNFACVATPLNKELRKGQLQVFDALANHETTALKPLKAKLVEPHVLPLPR